MATRAGPENKLSIGQQVFVVDKRVGTNTAVTILKAVPYRVVSFDSTTIVGSGGDTFIHFGLRFIKRIDKNVCVNAKAVKTFLLVAQAKQIAKGNTCVMARLSLTITQGS